MMSDEYAAANAPATPGLNPTTVATPAKSPATVLSPARKRSLSGYDDHAVHRPDGAPHPPVEHAVDAPMDEAWSPRVSNDSTLDSAAVPATHSAK
ncbi:hypothetical protein AMAG_18288 [Allomyces macrogynus ATCC 38327]|uniref:Uncharacterized protein n=1 Tax=Allomyces macrogynus (strain ATCC 38327) TaxID=578462 RepID=A0A0L0S8B8_ALLM3|nr:hypothetical protein AMAG_18288 [Allomyces macrogynus ATCC 38327]|eukprot:KNE58650.1 hypothetical protein AMAG_18288 [Allomyces macrogynus ATCC 38327]